MCGMGHYDTESPGFDDHDARTLSPEELRQRELTGLVDDLCRKVLSRPLMQKELQVFEPLNL